MSRGVRGGGEHLAPLDDLRGIAIALVVWFHLWEMTWLRADAHLGPFTMNLNAIPEAGFIGVDLFFFLSGFVLFSPYARALFDGGETPTLATFDRRRDRVRLGAICLSGRCRRATRLTRILCPHMVERYVRRDQRRALVVPEWVGASEKSDGWWGIAFSTVALVVSLGVAWVLTIAVEIPLIQCGTSAVGAVKPNFSSARM